jgi:hypothetical protein
MLPRVITDSRLAALRLNGLFLKNKIFSIYVKEYEITNF